MIRVVYLVVLPFIPPFSHFALNPNPNTSINSSIPHQKMSSSRRERRFQHSPWLSHKLLVESVPGGGGMPSRPANQTANLFREYFPPARPEAWGTATPQQLEQLRDNNPCLRQTQHVTVERPWRVELLRRNRDMDVPPGGRVPLAAIPPPPPPPTPTQQQQQQQQLTEERRIGSGSEMSDFSFTTARESSLGPQYEDALEEQVVEEGRVEAAQTQREQ